MNKISALWMCSQWRSQPKNLGGAKMCDFRGITLFCLENRLSNHKMTIFSKNLGDHGPFAPPLATPMCVVIREIYVL